jgi:CubicO group peptidase (beta-lactamase class C family)
MRPGGAYKHETACLPSDTQVRQNASRREFLGRIAIGASPPILGGCSVQNALSSRGNRQRFREEQLAGLEREILDSATKHNVPGISLCVVADAQVLWSKGLGVQDAASNVPVSDGSIFEAASMSKPVFAYAAMKMRERGIIDLDKPLSTYTPERFLDGDPRLDLITARHVLSHTSGFPDIQSREHPLSIQFRPGEKWQYSGEGYAYLQSVTTRLTGHQFASPCGTYETDLKVCGTDFDAYMKSNVLQPLRMGSSGYLWHGELAKRMARPHDDHGRPLPVRKYTSADAARYGSMGGLLTTAADYARFLIAVMSPMPADAFRLNEASTGEMLTPQVRVENGHGYSISWALGWKVAITADFGVLVSHGGDQSGFHSLAEMSIKRKSAYVILTNGENGWKLIQEIAPVLARRVHTSH